MEKQNQKIRVFLRILIAGIATSTVWYLGLVLIFRPAQQILANPEYQSSKFLAVFTEIEPLPKMVIQPTAFYAGFLIVGILFSLAFHLVSQWLPEPHWKKGLLFGFVAWLLMIPWFEFYLPWNVMHEPLLLVLLEAVLWLIILLILGIVTIYIQKFLESKNL